MLLPTDKRTLARVAPLDYISVYTSCCVPLLHLKMSSTYLYITIAYTTSLDSQITSTKMRRRVDALREMVGGGFGMVKSETVSNR